MLSPSQHRGFSLTEMLLSLALLSVLTLVTALALKDSQTMWRQLVGSSDSDAQLRRVHVQLQRDMEMAGAQIGTGQVPPSLASTFDGDAIWFLSPLDGNGQAARKFNGNPLYQRNILYYLVVPNNHAQLFGYNCPGGPGPGGYDDRCPHKVLVRKVIDFSPVTTSTDDLSEESLMTPAQIAPFLTRPNGHSTANMSGESALGLQSVSLAARQLLWFRVSVVPPPVQVEIRATNLLRANKSLAVGTASLLGDPLTSEMRLTLTSGNP